MNYSSTLTTTLLLAVIILFLFNFNFDIFNAGAASGPISGQGTSGFISKWLEPPPPPVVSNVIETDPDYCFSGPAATITWAYSDPNNSPQDSYQVQITNTGSFNNPVYDSCVPAQGTCASGNTSSSNFTGQGVLQFNVTYKARVRAWNSLGGVSEWEETESFKTPNHAYPYLRSAPYLFTWSPSNPAANIPIQFTDNTWFDPSSSNKQWSWTFVPAGGGPGTSTAQNPSYTFNTFGIYQITEGVRDNAMPPGQYCFSPTQALNVQRPIPIWKEIAPR